MKIKQIGVKAQYIDEVVIPGIYSQAALDNPEVYGGPNEACALALRHAIKAAPGNELVVADWRNIEGRVIAWLADEDWKLAAYRAQDAGGRDTYALLFSQFFGTPVDQVTDQERQGGKVVDLACGFGGGVGAVVTMAAAYQMDLTPMVDVVLPRATPEQLRRAEKAWRRAYLSGEDYLLEPNVYIACDVLKQVYRQANSKINELRNELDDAVKTAVGGDTQAFHVGRCMIWTTRSWLIIQLPSGRRLLYAAPKLVSESTVDPDTGAAVHRQYITYATARGKTWRREKAWSGLFLENIVQAIANDVLRGAMLRVHEDSRYVIEISRYLETLPPEERTAICLHVHDELVLDVPKGSYPLDRLIRQMTAGETWSTGLPLAAAGWVNERYGKR
jgi:DNA polymerase